MPRVMQYALTIVGLTFVFGGVIGFKLYKEAKVAAFLKNAPAAIVPVNGVVARSEVWPQQIPAIGSLRARRGIEIRSEVDGVISGLYVNSGQGVKQGEILVEIDDIVDRATLKSARVRLDKSQKDFERDRSLFERGLVSEGQFDGSRSEFESAEALVEELQGKIGKKTIRAPFDGTVGIHNLTEGQYLDAGDRVVDLQAVETLFLDMYLPEKELGRIKPGQVVVFTVPSHGDAEFTGEVEVVDVAVQATTRNVLVRALVDNGMKALRPGMFAEATLVLADELQVVTVPREAVAFSLFGETVFLLEKKGGTSRAGDAYQARRIPVNTGDVRKGQITVKELRPGQLIALDSQHRLLDGTPVRVANLTELEAGTDGVTESD